MCNTTKFHSSHSDSAKLEQSAVVVIVVRNNSHCHRRPIFALQNNDCNRIVEAVRVWHQWHIVIIVIIVSWLLLCWTVTKVKQTKSTPSPSTSTIPKTSTWYSVDAHVTQPNSCSVGDRPLVLPLEYASYNLSTISTSSSSVRLDAVVRANSWDRCSETWTVMWI